MNVHMAGNAEESSALKPRAVDRSASGIMHKSRAVKLKLTEEFDALQTIEQITDLMHPIGYHERIILDFSDASRAKPVELYRLFAELATAPQFNYIEIRIEGLQFSYRAGTTQTHRESRLK